MNVYIPPGIGGLPDIPDIPGSLILGGMTTSLTLTQLRGVRLIAQLLAPSAALPHTPTTAVGVAKHMLATQAQNRPASLMAIDLRSGAQGGAAEAVGTSLLIRTWSQRGTHHLLAAEDVRWMTLLCSPRILAASARRRASLGLDSAAVNRARDILTERAHTPVPRTEAYQLFASVGVDPGENRGQHLLRHFGGEGTIVQGPPRGAEDTFVLLDSVCVLSLDIQGDAALEEMTLRYFRARGVATAKDLQWWSGLTVAQVRRGIELAANSGEIHQATGPAGEIMWMPSWARDITDAEIRQALEPELLLPAFDEYLLSYADRSHVMDTEHSTTIGPGKNGVFRTFRVVAGEALPTLPG